MAVGAAQCCKRRRDFQKRNRWHTPPFAVSQSDPHRPPNARTFAQIEIRRVIKRQIGVMISCGNGWKPSQLEPPFALINLILLCVEIYMGLLCSLSLCVRVCVSLSPPSLSLSLWRGTLGARTPPVYCGDLHKLGLYAALSLSFCATTRQPSNR